MLTPDPEHDVTGNGTESHYDLARQLEMRGYTVDADPECIYRSWIRHEMTGDDILGEIYGDEEATVESVASFDARKQQEWDDLTSQEIPCYDGNEQA